MSGLASLLLLLLLLSCQISEGSKHVEACQKLAGKVTNGEYITMGCSCNCCKEIPVAKRFLISLVSLSGAKLNFDDAITRMLLQLNITETNCPSRKKNFAVRTGHICQRSCERRQCSKTRKCECDGKCGLSCISPVLRCPWPVTVDNAETHLAQESHGFGDFMTVTCQSGYRIPDGQEMSVSRCQGDGKWSVTARCEEVFTFANVCKPPPEIENGYHENGPYTIGKEVLYTCKSGYWLQGSNSLRCQENEEWSDNAPTCHPVTCSRPPNIAQSTLVAVHQSEYPIGTIIYYLCQKDFFLDGSNRVVCLKNGTWSHLPYCRARCPVIAQRSRIIYNGHKVWAYEIPNGFVHHGETVTFFCRSQNKTCNFEAESRCFDGVLKIPDCYDEPTYLQYHLFTKRVVSEIGAC